MGFICGRADKITLEIGEVDVSRFIYRRDIISEPGMMIVWIPEQDETQEGDDEHQRN